jgi:hypothetical protein
MNDSMSNSVYWKLGLLVLVIWAYNIVTAARMESQKSETIPSIVHADNPVLWGAAGDSLQTSLDVLSKWSLAEEDARKLSAFYKAYATVLTNNRMVFTKAEYVRTIHAKGGVLAFNGDLVDKYPGLSVEIDNVLAQSLGLQYQVNAAGQTEWIPKDLTTEDVDRLIVGLTKLSTALNR